MSQRTEKVTAAMQGVEPRQQAAETIPELRPLTVNQYITDRVQDQIQFYNSSAGKHQQKADLYRHATAVLMGISAVLTLAATIDRVSVWAPVVATVTASLTAQLRNQQHQALTSSYSATYVRLSSLLSEWIGSGKTDADKPERNAFMQRCEDTMAAENGGWSALWAKKE